MIDIKNKRMLLNSFALGMVALSAYLAIEPTIHFVAPNNMQVVSTGYSDNVILNIKFVALSVVLAGLVILFSTYLSKRTTMATTNAVVVLIIVALIGLAVSLLAIKNSMSSLYILFEGTTHQQYEHSSAISRTGLSIERIPLTGIVLLVVTFLLLIIFLPKKKLQ